MTVKQNNSASADRSIVSIDYLGVRHWRTEDAIEFETSNFLPKEIDTFVEYIRSGLSRILLARYPSKLISVVKTPGVRLAEGEDSNYRVVLKVTGADLTEDIATEFEAHAAYLINQVKRSDLVSDEFNRDQYKSVAPAPEEAEIDQLVTDFLTRKKGKAIGKSFLVSIGSADNSIHFPAFEYQHPEVVQEEAVDISGVGVVDGYRRSDNAVWLYPLIGSKRSQTALKFVIEKDSVFTVLEENNIHRKVIHYSAQRKQDAQGKMQNYVSEIMVTDPEMTLDGELPFF